MPEQNDKEIRRRSIWYGTVTFGLVSIPVGLFPGQRSQRIRMRMLAPDGTPLVRQYYCPREDRQIEPEEIIRGYEIEKGKFVTVTEDELEALAPEKSREIDLRRFVPVEQIGLKFLDRPYFLVPMSQSRKPYRLLTETMEKSKKAGIATFVMRSREYLVAILAENGILIAETLRFADELRSPEITGEVSSQAISKARIKAMAEEISNAAADGLDMDELKDTYTEHLTELVEQKRSAGQDLVESPEEERQFREAGKVIDLMQVMKRSIKNG